MLNLMKLERMKMKLGWYVKGAVMANVLIIALLSFAMYTAQVEGELFVASHQEAFILIGAIVRATFIIFAAVLIAKMIIEEYSNKTILILFSYPINRKKIIASKLLIIGALTFITMLLSNIIVVGSFSIIHHYIPLVPFQITMQQYVGEVIKMVPYSIATAGISLIPLYFGMRKHSVPATICSSIIVVMIACSSYPSFSLVTFIPLQLGLAAVGVAIAYFSIRTIEKEDLV
ncbi:ABC transporter permease [Peribacillus sp. NPDC046944]|uniref:ABC transporter permease n=1 Tax=unclassified Peribacillus TaxID=2675266 RepID=UPI0038202609